MAAMAGILNHSMTAGQALQGAGANRMAVAPQAAAGAAAPDSAAATSSATISSNDFLTLLVTEMQNQDPTAQTDPNEYINQLVQVNSLEQLISINQNLSTALGVSGSSASGQSASSQASTAVSTPYPSATSVTGAPGKAASPAPVAHRAASLPTTRSAGSNTAAAISQFANARQAPGNLAVPRAQGAANKVAHALDGRGRPHWTPGKPA